MARNSRYKNYWRPIVVDMIRRNPTEGNISCIQEYAFCKGIKAAKEKLSKNHPHDYEDILKAVDMVFVKKTHTIHGASRNINVSYGTLKRWLNEYIRLVGESSGF